MRLASVRLVTGDVDRLVAYYALITGLSGHRLSPDFAEFRVDGALALAISSQQMIEKFNAGAAVAGANRSAIIEFQVDDVDAVQTRLGAKVDYAMPATDMPWGNRSMLLRDPDGNVVNIFARPTAA